MEVIEDALVLELVGLVENEDTGRAVVLTQSFEEFVFRRRLAVDVHSLAESFEDSVEDAIARVVLPAVDILVLDIEDGLAELLQCELCDTGFPST